MPKKWSSNVVIGVRVTPEDKELLEKMAKARGGDLSDFIRLAYRKELAALGYLSLEEKKALGVR